MCNSLQQSTVPATAVYSTSYSSLQHQLQQSTAVYSTSYSSLQQSTAPATAVYTGLQHQLQPRAHDHYAEEEERVTPYSAHTSGGIFILY